MFKGDPLPWLLETDADNPGVRYFALRQLLDLPATDPGVTSARAAIMQNGPVPRILAAQSPDGYWVKPGGGYSPKYRSTVWSLLILAELGADPHDRRVRQGCEYVLQHSLAANGAFSGSQKPVPSSAVHCLNGNLFFALQRLGYGSDPRLAGVAGWMAAAILGEARTSGEPLRYYASGTSGPNFACSVNLKQPCAWGANKALRGLLEIPPAERTPLIQRALQAGADFLLSRDPAAADYPYTARVSSTWFKLGFPLSYWSDVLETLSVLLGLGYGGDRRLAPALEWVASKQDEQGRWKLENSLNGKMWLDIEKKGAPSKWVTLRALRVFKRAGQGFL